ncbi:MAG: glycosyltransferase [Synechococcaceae cyanobacterium SM2_3_1]|nr:glycosyltransferase [Synechococcaceae cyanobacterium SM2_3_1]
MLIDQLRAGWAKRFRGVTLWAWGILGFGVALLLLTLILTQSFRLQWWFPFLQSQLWKDLNLSSWTPTLPETAELSPGQSLDPFTFRSPPTFLQIPHQPFDLFWPLLLVVIGCSLLRFLPFSNRTRVVVNTAILLIMGRYLLWRSLSTLNLSSAMEALFSLLVFFNEVIACFSFFLGKTQSILSTDQQRRQEADQLSQAILTGSFLPSVDVLIPTYNEPEFVVRRTAVGCLAMDYPNKQVYILDDTRRPPIRQLAAELGCRYLTRADNRYAKAGNLNHALPHSQGQLIAVMDADFVPFTNFLTRTVGFFLKPEVALVQTPQSFYNSDHHVRNLGIDHLMHNDLAYFFEVNQSHRDYFNASICCGTSYVVRRSHLRAVDGYLIRCINEDSPTSIKMLTRGLQVVYLNEILSMGESTRTYVDFIKQRTRWHHSNYQIFFCGDDIPIWKLGWPQRIFFLSWYISCFQPFFRLIFILTPMLSLALGFSPILATSEEFIYYLLPWLLVIVLGHGWATEYRNTFLWNEVYETILCWPLLRCQLFALRSPFGLRFKVTRKGVQTDKRVYNLNLTWPLLLGIGVMGISLVLYWTSLRPAYAPRGSFGMVMMSALLVYQMLLMAIAFLAGIDQPERRLVDRFPLRTSCLIQVPGGDATQPPMSYQGNTLNLSEQGAYLQLDVRLELSSDKFIDLYLQDYDLWIPAKICRQQTQKGSTQLALEFQDVDPQTNRKLVEILYTTMTWWKQSKKLGSLEVAVALLTSLVTLKPLLRGRLFQGGSH